MNQVISVYMVVVSMGKEQTNRMKLFLLDILQQMALFIWIISTTIYNNCLACLVRKYMSTFLARIHHPFLQLNHSSSSFCLRMSMPAKTTRCFMPFPLLSVLDYLHKVTRQDDVLYINSLGKQGCNLFFTKTSNATANFRN